MNELANGAHYELYEPEKWIKGYIEQVSSESEHAWSASHAAWQLTVLKHYGYVATDLTLPVRAAVAKVVLHLQELDLRSADAEWYRIVSTALPLAALFCTSEEIQPLVKPLMLDLQPEYAGPIGPDVPRVYLLAANYFKPEAEDATARIEDLCKSRSKRAKLSTDLYVAAISGSQKEYASALKASLKHFKGLRRPPLDCTFPGEWVATEQSLIHELAIREGKTMPDIPSDLTCFLVTRETLELAPG